MPIIALPPTEKGEEPHPRSTPVFRSPLDLTILELIEPLTIKDGGRLPENAFASVNIKRLVMEKEKEERVSR